MIDAQDFDGVQKELQSLGASKTKEEYLCQGSITFGKHLLFSEVF